MAMLVFASSAGAATYAPNTTADDFGSSADCPAAPAVPAPGACSLREAVLAANGTLEDDEIVLEGKTYELDPENPTLTIDKASDAPWAGGTLLIRGTSARETIIDGNSNPEIGVRPITFDAGAQGELRDLAVTGGNGIGCGECIDDYSGGGIAVRDFDGESRDDAQALLTRVRVFDNGADLGGGGILNRGKLTLVQSLVDGNVAGQSGGGIENADEMTLVNSTVSGNTALGKIPSLRLQAAGEGNGGGIYNSGRSGEQETGNALAPGPVPADAPFVRAENSTIAFNEAGGNGGGVYTYVDPCASNPSQCEVYLTATGGPIARFHNTIVSDNTADGDSNCSGNQPEDSGEFTSSEGHNLEDGDSCLFTADGDLDKASGLAPLADNGGGTNTHKLNDGSAAIDAAEASGCPAVDQRGTARPQRNGCDIGAFEREPDPVQEQPQQEQPQQQEPLPQPGTPEARGPRCLDTQPPLTTLDRDGLRVTKNSVTLSGVSRDRGRPCASGVQRVEVSMAKVSGTDLNCRFIRRSNRFLLSPFQNCRRPIRFIADGTTQWTFKFSVKLAPGKYRAQARGYDEERNKETPKKRQNIVTFTVK